MFSASTVQHLRFKFSLLLLPIFLFATAVAMPAPPATWLLLAVVLHVLVYPASNGYNSYYDRDEESIGGVEKPLPVQRDLWLAANLLDGLALLLGLLADWRLSAGLLGYILVSRAYSYEGVRLKRYPVLSWLVVGFFQGAYTFALVCLALHQFDWAILQEPKVWQGALLSSAMLWGSYPMTQVYQHTEDARRGDTTLSLMLGIRGTFIFTLLMFGAASTGYAVYFSWHYHWLFSVGFGLAMLPVVGYFLWWFARVIQSPAAADYRHTMRLNSLSATCLNVFFALWCLVK